MIQKALIIKGRVYKIILRILEGNFYGTPANYGVPVLLL